MLNIANLVPKYWFCYQSEDNLAGSQLQRPAGGSDQVLKWVKGSGRVRWDGSGKWLGGVSCESPHRDRSRCVCVCVYLLRLAVVLV